MPSAISLGDVSSMRMSKQLDFGLAHQFYGRKKRGSVDLITIVGILSLVYPYWYGYMQENYRIFGAANAYGHTWEGRSARSDAHVFDAVMDSRSK
jgi:hypothetical protein